VKSVVLLLILIIAVGALAFAFRRLPLAYAGYALAALIATIWSPVAGQPLASLDRYSLTIFPLWMAAGLWLSERRETRAVLVFSAVLLALWSAQFGSWYFVA
jgi:hypothetical protein